MDALRRAARGAGAHLGGDARRADRLGAPARDLARVGLDLGAPHAGDSASHRALPVRQSAGAAQRARACRWKRRRRAVQPRAFRTRRSAGRDLAGTLVGLHTERKVDLGAVDYGCSIHLVVAAGAALL